MLDNPIISVIIPSHDSQGTLKFCLDALMKQSGSVDFEIIVVDCSPHDLVERLCARYPRVRFRKEEQKFNPGIGRNVGASLAKGKVFVFIDADIVPSESILMKITEFWQRGYHVFSAAFDLYPSIRPSLANFLEYYYFCHQYQPRRQLQERKNLGSMLLIIDRNIFEEVHGFSGIARMQDTELTDRLFRRGIKLYFIPEVLGYIIYDSSFKKVLKKIFINGNNIYFIRYGEKISIVKRIVLGLFLPLAAIAKISRIVLRHFRYQNADRLLLSIAMVPMLYFCGFLWMLGFYRAIFFQKGISKDRS